MLTQLTSAEPLMRYRKLHVISGKGRSSGQFADALRGLAVDAADRIYAVGDSKVVVFSADSRPLRLWATDRPGYAVAVGKDDTVYVGQEGQVQLFDSAGKLRDTWRDPARLGLVTAIGLTDDAVLIADVKDRCLRRFDRSGKFLNNIGKDNRMKGFLVPNRHLDFAVDARGVIHACNPGKHRVERYSLDGKLLGHFGRFDGRHPAGFTGCCNPTNLALTPQGNIVTAEKAEPRVKVYDTDGTMLALLGQGDFDLNCKNTDLAVDSRGRIYVIDTVRLHIRVYAPAEPAPATQPAPTTREATP